MISYSLERRSRIHTHLESPERYRGSVSLLFSSSGFFSLHLVDRGERMHDAAMAALPPLSAGSSRERKREKETVFLSSRRPPARPCARHRREVHVLHRGSSSGSSNNRRACIAFVTSMRARFFPFIPVTCYIRGKWLGEFRDSVGRRAHFVFFPVSAATRDN